MRAGAGPAVPVQCSGRTVRSASAIRRGKKTTLRSGPLWRTDQGMSKSRTEQACVASRRAATSRPAVGTVLRIVVPCLAKGCRTINVVPPMLEPDHTREELLERITKLESSLRQVERWSLETCTDLTAAGYDQWAQMLPPRPVPNPETPLLPPDQIDGYVLNAHVSVFLRGIIHGSCPRQRSGSCVSLMNRDPAEAATEPDVSRQGDPASTGWDEACHQKKSAIGHLELWGRPPENFTYCRSVSLAAQGFGSGTHQISETAHR